ncbi:hypothetical protein [Saccharolobus shibatae]|uniref:hypothetical protein n=1 Tax=Saccharolobus shibatae TaxID=2286 RepID=UPI001C47466A|nr:hypothetical protein [Saccharolobus shibatae]
MLSLGLVDSRVIRNHNAGSERHVREVLKRLSYRYKLYYLPTPHAFLSYLSTERLEEVKKYAKVPSFFESLVENPPKTSLLRELFTFSPLAKKLGDNYK